MSPMKSSSGLDENIAGMLCYLFTFVGELSFSLWRSGVGLCYSMRCNL